MSRHLKIALVAAAALTIATWSLPATANGEKPAGASVSEKSVVATPKKVRRAALRKRIAWRVRQPAPVAVPYPWFAPRYERIAVYWPVLLGVGF
jgi:hypothetical protein